MKKEIDTQKHAEKLRRDRERMAKKHAAETPEEHMERLRRKRERYRERVSDPKEREKMRERKRRNYHRYYQKLKADPVRYTEFLEKDSAKTKARRAVNLDVFRDRERRRWQKHKEERNKRRREYYKRTKDMKNAQSAAYYQEHKEALLAKQKARRSNNPAIREQERLKARMRYERNKKMRLCDLDLAGILAYLKRGVQPAWKRRVDYSSQYCPDSLIGKAYSMDQEDIRAAELRGYGLERAIEAMEAR